MHYLLFTVGTFGDLNPYLGLGEVLHRRGHQVTLMTNPQYESTVRETGLRFVPVGELARLDYYLNHPDFFNASRSWKLALDICYLGPMRATYHAIEERFVPGETVVVSASWGFGARIAQEKLGVPLVTVHLEPHNIRSMYQTGVMPPPMVLKDWVPHWLKRFQFWIADRIFVDPRVGPQVNAFRRELNLPPVKRLLFEWWNSPQQMIGMYPKWLVPPQPDWPSQLRLSGFPLWDRNKLNKTPAAEVRNFVESGEPPIVFTAGSNNVHARHFFATAVESCQQLDRRAILVTRDADHVPQHFPDTIRRFAYVPFSELLPHAAAFVHHGGAGTSAQALAAGVPQLVMPTVHGTPEFASRLKRLGVAETLKPSAFQTKAVTRAIQRLIESTQVAQLCRQYREQMCSENGIEQACNWIEQFADSTS